MLLLRRFSTEAIQRGGGSGIFHKYAGLELEGESSLNAVLLLLLLAPSEAPGSVAQGAWRAGLGLQCPGIWLTAGPMSCLSLLVYRCPSGLLLT